MESPDINNPAREDDQLRALLSAEQPPLPAKAFTARVITALPPPHRSPVHPILWMLVSALAGLFFALIKGGSWNVLAQGSASVASAFKPILAAATDPWFLLALAITALSLLLTFAITWRLVRRAD